MHGILQVEDIKPYKDRHGDIKYSCRICARLANKRFYQNNKQELLKKSSEWRDKNRIRSRLTEKNRVSKDREAYNNKQRNFYKRNISIYRIRDKIKKFGLTAEEYYFLLESQEGLCAICNLPETRIDKGKVCTLALDHNHTTGKIRKFLCAQCNMSLGGFKENIATLQSAITYLTHHENQE